MSYRRRHNCYDDQGSAVYQQLTDGEKTIWAFAFNQILGPTLDRLDSTPDPDKLKLAAECACSAVMNARFLAKQVASDESEWAYMARSMVNRRKADIDQDDEVSGVLEWLCHNRFQKTAKQFCEEALIEIDE